MTKGFKRRARLRPQPVTRRPPFGTVRTCELWHFDQFNNNNKTTIWISLPLVPFFPSKFGAGESDKFEKVKS